MSKSDLDEMPFEPKRISAALNLIFWGGIVCLFDVMLIEPPGEQAGFRLDLLNDVLGATMVAVGVFRLAWLPVGGRYAAAMTFVQLMAVVAVLDAVRRHYVFPLSPMQSYLVCLLALAKVAAILVFCWGMLRVCKRAGLADGVRRWKISSRLVAWLYLAPLVLVAGARGVLLVSGNRYGWSLARLGFDEESSLLLLLVLAVGMIPLVSVFVSLRRTEYALDAMDAERNGAGNLHVGSGKLAGG